MGFKGIAHDLLNCKEQPIFCVNPQSKDQRISCVDLSFIRRHICDMSCEFFRGEGAHCL